MIIDGTNLILGRLASFAAKNAIEGEKVVVVNCENVIITGNKKIVLARFKTKIRRGHPYHGPFYPRLPDRIVKRVIRGMLPYKKEIGKKAFKRVRCYIGVPDAIKNQGRQTIKNASMEKLKTLNYLPLKEVAKYFGWAGKI